MASFRRREVSDQGGYSLLELLVAMTISGVAMFLATGLLLEANSRMSRQAEENVRPVVSISLRQIRSDIRSCHRARSPLLPGWSREPLVLLGHPTGPLQYRKQGPQLVREVLTSVPGKEPDTRLMLDRVSTFRWRLRGQLVEVDLGVWKKARLSSIQRSWAWRSVGSGSETRRLFWAHPRAGGQVAW